MTDRIRDRIAEALDDAYQRHYDEGYGLPAQEMATDILAALLDGAEREPRTRLDDLTSDDLDRLYDDLDRYAEVLGEMNEQAVTNAKQLAALREVARGYCPACGRGDCAPTADQWYKQRQRADRAEAELRQYTEADSADAAAGSYAGRAEQAEQERDTAEAAVARVRALADECDANGHGSGHPLTVTRIRDALDPPAPAATQTTEHEKTTRVFAALHRSAEQDVSRVIALYEQWVKAGPPPLGTSMSRWWDRRLAELHRAIQPPDHDTDTPPAPAATEATGTWTEPAHARPCTATIHGRATPGGRPVTCTREAGHPENHVGPKQGSNGRVLWTDHQAGATRHGMAS